jgi:hypothetical protein
MEPVERGTRGAGEAARECLRQGVAALAATERRHESLMAWAESTLGLTREHAEQVYALAEESGLEPVYAFLLIRCGIGVQELEAPAQDADEAAAQQTPPDWVGTDHVRLDDVTVERRLRTTFRRLGTHLERASTVSAAVEAFLSDPDVDAVPLS